MPRPTVADEARIAIAFCALQFKPERQSFASYVLDLRTNFPRASESPPGDVVWRERVLDLEQDLAYLQTKYNQERIKALSLQTGEAAEPTVVSVQPVSATRKKIKRKSHPNAVSRIDLEAVLSSMNRDAIPTISTPQSIFSSFNTLKNLTEHSNDEKVLPITLLAAAAGRALKDLGVLLRTLLLPRLCSSAPVEMLQAVAILLSYLLTTVLPLFISRLNGKHKARAQDSSIIIAMDEFLGQLTNLIFIPLARSFSLLSQSHTANIFSSKHATDGGTAGTLDIRPDLCRLLSRAMSDLDLLGSLAAARLVHSLCGVRECVALETVRAMEKNIPAQWTQAARSIPDTATGDTRISRIRTDRIDKLARKDTLWYLCSILHILFTPSSGSASSAARLTSKMSHNGHEYVFAAMCQNKLLEDAILTGLSNIIGRNHIHPCITSPSHTKNTGTNDRSSYTGTGDSSICGDTGNGKLSGKWHGRITVDEVGHGMILAVVERVWLYWFGHGTKVD